MFNSVFDVGLFGIAVSAVTAFVTYRVSISNKVGREELLETIDKRCEMCKENFAAYKASIEKLDEIRNGRVSRLEETAATKEDIARLERSICEIKQLISDVLKIVGERRYA